MKDLKEALRAHWWLVAWLTSGIGRGRRATTPDLRRATTQRALKICFAVIAEIEREIEELERNFPKSAANARRGSGKVDHILAVYDNLTDCAPHKRAAIIAERLGVGPQYVRKVINSGSKEK